MSKQEQQVSDIERYGFSSEIKIAENDGKEKKIQVNENPQNLEHFALDNPNQNQRHQRRHFEQFVSDTERYGFGEGKEPTEKEIQAHNREIVIEQAHTTEHFALDFSLENQHHERKHYDKYLSDTGRYGFVDGEEDTHQ